VDMNGLALGEDAARTVGVDVARARRLVFLAASLATAAAVAFAGPIGFVGIVVPHALRRLVGADHRLLLPAAVFGGAAFLVVADDQFSDWPPAAHAKPHVGNELTPSVERILALRPDVVFLATSANTRELADELGRLGVRVVVSRADTLDDVWRDITAIGAAVGRTEAAARLIAAARARLGAVARRVAGQARPRTLVVGWTEPLSL